MGDYSTGEFVLNTRSADEPATPDEAAAKAPKLLPLRNGGGSQMEEGRLRWYVSRLKGFDGVDASYELLLLACLTAAERERFGLKPKPLSPWFVAMLIDAGILSVNTEGELPWKVDFVADARRVIRAAISKTEGVYKLGSPVQKPKPAETDESKPTS